MRRSDAQNLCLVGHFAHMGVPAVPRERAEMPECEAENLDHRPVKIEDLSEEDQCSPVWLCSQNPNDMETNHKFE